VIKESSAGRRNGGFLCVLMCAIVRFNSHAHRNPLISQIPTNDMFSNFACDVRYLMTLRIYTLSWCKYHSFLEAALSFDVFLPSH
jgi:hypothetical protein